MRYFRTGTRIYVQDNMQSGYAYDLTCNPGEHFAPDFKPQLTPAEMLARGVFEGHYLTDCTQEFPAVWFKYAKLSPGGPDISLNEFGVKSRQPLSVWRKNGWILGPDVRGWFQWYCRYYLGRRLLGIDEIQIARWRSFYRHKAQILKNCSPGHLECRPRQRQALLQWAYDPNF